MNWQINGKRQSQNDPQDKETAVGGPEGLKRLRLDGWGGKAQKAKPKLTATEKRGDSERSLLSLTFELLIY